MHTYSIHMEFLAPPMYDVSNIDMWLFKISAYLKALGLHLYLATTMISRIVIDKSLGANTQALHALRQTLSKEHVSLISHCDSTFAVWNTLTSPKKQDSHILERELWRDKSDQAYFMVQGNDSLKVTSDTQLDDSASFSCIDNMDAHALNEKLSIFWENLLSKYKVLKIKSVDSNEENKNLLSKLNMIL